MASFIEPSSFDLVVLETGLPQCIVSAASSSSGHSVLHVDPCEFYGSHWTSLPLSDLKSWSESEGILPFSSAPLSQPISVEENVTDVLPTNWEKIGDIVDVSSSNEEKLHISPSDGENAGKHTDVLPSYGGKPENLEEILPPEGEKLENIADSLPRYGGKLENLANILCSDGETGEDIGKHEKIADIFQSDGEGFSNLENIADILPSDGGNLPSVEPNSLVMQEKNLEAIPLHPFSMYSNFEVTQASSEEILGPPRGYNIDIAGPKLAFCNGPLVDLVIRSGAHNYLQFRGLEASFIWTSEGISPVPSSRADIFKDRTLSAVEKRHLMRFFKMVIDHTSTSDLEASKLCEEDLDSPFVEFLQGQKLPSSVQAIILYAIALANDKQDLNMEDFSSVFSTREGMQNLALYLTSVGRYENALGAFLYPLYGQGELPQAFSRCAAVKGALYVLRMPVDALLRNKETHEFEGIQMSTGQLIFSKKLLTGPSLYATLRKTFNNNSSDSVDTSGDKETNHKIVRSICITDKSLQPGISTLIVVCPPQSITNKANSVIRALQLGADANVCPEGKFIVQLSMACSDALIGIEAMQAAIKVLFHCAESSGNISTDNKPTLLWAVNFVQHQFFSESFKWISEGHIAVSGVPDETLDYRSVVSSAEKIFQGLYPTDVFFAPTVSTTGEEDLDNYQSTDIVDVETQVEDGVESKSNSVANHSIDLTVSSECDVNGIRSELV